MPSSPTAASNQPRSGTACHFKIENPVEPDDHAQAGKDLRVILERQAGKAKQPLRVEHRVDAPCQIIATSQDKDDPVETPPCHQARVSWGRGAA